jgi:hypothetical protein
MTPMKDGELEAPATAVSEASTPAEPAFDRSALESTVGDKLAALDWDGIGGDEPAEPKPAAKPAAAEKDEAATEEGAEPSEEAEATDDAAATPDEEGAEKEQAEEQPEPQPKGEAKPTGPTLPAAYVRSLKAYGWEDAEIQAAMKADPANFLVAAQRIHKNRSDETARWAELGRQSRTQQDQPAGEQKATPARAQIKPVDVEALVEKHGNEDLVREITGPVNEAIAQINAVLPDLMTGVKSVQESRQQTLGRQIDGFFGGDELKPYAEFYGKDSASMSESQVENRNKVLELADALIAGAAQQGRALNVEEALTLAHDSVSGGFKVQAIRKQVKSAVQTRNKGITIRPTQKGSQANDGPAKNRNELESRTRDRLAAVFGG